MIYVEQEVSFVSKKKKRFREIWDWEFSCDYDDQNMLLEKEHFDCIIQITD